jgi:hypothetical protein
MDKVESGVMLFDGVEEFVPQEEYVINVDRAVIRGIVRGLYDVQRARISVGARITSNRYAKLGIINKSEKDASDPSSESLKVLKLVLLEYNRVADAVISGETKLKTYFDEETALISSESEFELIASYMKLVEGEKLIAKSLKRSVKEHPLWDGFLKDVPGCGEIIAGVIISEMDPRLARNPSSFVRYAGIDVVIVEDSDGNLHGEGRGKKSSHLVNVEYMDKNGEVKTKKSLGYNPFLKSKLLGVLGSSFLKTGGEYAEKYREYKFRKMNDPAWAGSSKMRLHRAALRYAVKIFLLNLWEAWRKIEGLEVVSSYPVAKLNMRPHGEDFSEEELGSDLDIDLGLGLDDI